MASMKVASSLVQISLVRRCAVLEMISGENRFNIDFIKDLNRALDVVENNSEVDALITTGRGKFYSNGLDLPFVLNISREKASEFMKDYSKLLARFVTFPLPTIAAINGHAFAAGGLLAMAHDYRLMREDRGWLCLNEVRLKLRFPPGVCDLLAAKVTQKRSLMDFLVFGKRYTGTEALRHQLVHSLHKENDLCDNAVLLAERLVDTEAFDRSTLRTMKMDLYKNAVKDLTRDFTFQDLELFSPSSRF